MRHSIKRIIRHWHIIVILLIWFSFAYPYVVQGLVPYPARYQATFFAPWNAYRQYWGPVKNNAMPDVIDQIYPWKQITISELKNGRLPTWNPFNFSGNPHIANYQTAVFSPFNVLFFFLPFIDAWSVLILIQPLIAAIGMFLFLREARVSVYGSVLGCIAFMFCGFMVVWLAYGTLSMAAAFLPLVLYGIERSCKRMTIFSGLIIAVSIAVSFFSGHFQTSIYVLLFSVAYFLFKSLSLKKEPQKIAMIGGYILLGVLISAIQVVPSIQFYNYSSRSGIFLQSGSGIPLQYLVTMIAPDFFGNPVTRNDWFGYYAEWAGFIGVIPFFLSIFAVTRKNRLSLFFLIASVVTLLFAIESPIYKAFVQLRIPVLGTSTPSRIIMLTSFSLCVLAGFGIDRLRTILEGKKLRQLIAGMAFCLSVLGVIWVLVLIIPLLPADKSLIAQRNLILPTVLLLIAIMVCGITMLFLQKKLISLLLILLIGMAGFDSYRYISKWMPFDDRSLVFPGTPVVSAMQQLIGYGRIFGNLGTQTESYYGLASIEGYDPLYVQRYGEFIRSAETGKYTPAERSVVRLSRRGIYTDRVLDFLGVNLIFHPIPDTNQGWAYPVWENTQKYKIMYTDDKFQLFRNTTAMPRANLYYQYEVIPDEKKLLERFFTENFLFRETVLMEEKPSLSTSHRDSNATVNILSYQQNKITIQVTTQSDALLVLTDNYYPTWSATVNGKKTRIYRVNYTFRAVEVPSGTSRIEFTNSII
jgi:hypothetical protein